MTKRIASPATKRSVRTIASIIGFLAAIFVGWLVTASHTVPVSQDTVQSLMDTGLKKLKTIEGRKLTIDYTINIREVEMELRESTGVTLYVFVDGTIEQRPYTARLSVTGEPKLHKGIVYVKPTGPLEVQDFDITSRGEGAKTDLIATGIGMVAKWSGKSEEDIEQVAVDIVRDNLSSTMLPKLLANVPVFKLEDLDKLGAKGWVARHTLDKFEVKDHSIELTFTLWQLTKKIIISVVVVVSIIGLALLCPECFMVFAAFSSWN